jgi:enoyl-CoA hydratase/carnithine racemase
MVSAETRWGKSLVASLAFILARADGTAMSWETVQLDVEDDVATLTVDRPERLNALDAETLDGIYEALAETEEQDARALVIRGAGDDAFVAGADISYMQDLDPAAAADYCEHGQRVMRAIEDFPAPVIAAINGYAFGGGSEIALASDIRVASDQAVIGQTEITLGIVPGWGGTWRLAKVVGEEQAKRMVYLGDRLSAEEAEAVGVVGEVVPHDAVEDRAREIALEIAEGPAFAMTAAKEAIDRSFDADRTTMEAYERRLWSGLFGSHDQREGMEAFLEDRDPEFG